MPWKKSRSMMISRTSTGFWVPSGWRCSLSAFSTLPKSKPGDKFLWMVTAASIVLVLIPTTQIAWRLLKPEFKAEFPSDWYPPVQAVESQPDVYYFILDGYAREDLMLERTGYNNADFVEALTDRGFYVAKCSRTNYNNTIIALTSTLNMQSYQALEEQAKSQGMTGKQIWRYLKPNLTMQTFQSMGYQTVAFDSGYYWSSMEDVDVYLQPWLDPGDPPHMTAFEYLLLKSTPLVALYEREGGFESTALDDLLFPWRYHVAQEEYILDQAPHIAEMDAPTFSLHPCHDPARADGVLSRAHQHQPAVFRCGRQLAGHRHRFFEGLYQWG